MRVDIVFQNPGDRSSRLVEAILRIAPKSKSFLGVFAFATRSGINALFETPNFQNLLSAGSIKVIVGIDAVTTDLALGSLIGLQERYKGFEAYAFFNNFPGNPLFHPKICQFELSSGGIVSIVGSNNLTVGGISNNFEFFTIIETEKGENHPLSLEDSLLIIKDNIVDIDFNILELARKNVIHYRRSLETLLANQEAVSEEDSERSIDDPAAGGKKNVASTGVDDLAAGDGRHTNILSENRILLAEIPGAGDRWQQIHYNQNIISDFFQVSANDEITIQPWANGIFLPVETRKCVYSEVNKNYKIEATVLKGKVYPSLSDGRPIMITLEKGLREFSYLVLFPGDDFYDEVRDLNLSHPAIGRGVHRSICTYAELLKIWPDCPLI